MLSYKTSDFGDFVVKLEIFFYYSSEKDMEKSISINEAINELHDSIINENFTIFMGAGVSKHVNSNYPVWSGVTQKYENKYGYEKLKETVKSLFPETTADQSFYNELSKTRPTYLISTNWDNMLQNYIQSSLEMYDVIADDSELMNSKLYNKYLKIHGDFQHSNASAISLSSQ